MGFVVGGWTRQAQECFSSLLFPKVDQTKPLWLGAEKGWGLMADLQMT